MREFASEVSKFRESFVNEGPGAVGSNLDAGNTTIFNSNHCNILLNTEQNVESRRYLVYNHLILCLIYCRRGIA